MEAKMKTGCFLHQIQQHPTGIFKYQDSVSRAAPAEEIDLQALRDGINPELTADSTELGTRDEEIPPKADPRFETLKSS
jgi:hypothetical protein